MGRHYTLHDGELRILGLAAAGQAGTPYYFKVKFIGADPQIPGDRPRAEQRLVLDRGRGSTDMKYTKGPDDIKFAPIDIMFTAMIDENVNRWGLLEALKCGTLGSHNWVSSKGTTQVDGVTLPDFDNDTYMQTVNMEIMYTGATVNWGLKCAEVFFPPELVLFGPADSEGIPFSATGRAYGPITSLSAFTTANVESTMGINA